MQRKIDPKLQALYDAGKEVYSFSRLDSFHTCAYGFYKKYFEHAKDLPNVYSSLGSACHDILQHYIDDGQDDTLEAEIMACLDDLDLMGVEFPKDRNGGDSIREHWVDDMVLFARNFKAPEGKFETEKFVLYTQGDIYLQGYIDLLRYNDDGTVTILDWKTSSMYKGDDIKTHSRQLTTYAMACEQLGLKVRDVGWIFLKYATYEKEYKNGSRRLFTKEWRSLPEAAISPRVAIVTYPFTKETQEECREYIQKTVDAIRRYKDDIDAYNPCNISRQSYFCQNLCGVRKECPYLRDYNAQFVKDDDEDLF